jgi:hypothetical protein
MASKASVKTIAISLILGIASIGAVVPAESHNAILYADKTEAPVGETVEVIASLSEPFGAPDLPLYSNGLIGYNFGPLKVAAFNGGAVSDLEVSYVQAKDGTKKYYTYQEVESAFIDQKRNSSNEAAYVLMRNVVNGSAASYKIASEGTITFVGASSFGDVKAFAKVFVNLSGDGESTKPRAAHFDFDGIELRPVDDLAGVKPGDSVRVEALLGGKPQSGVVVYVGYKDLDKSKWLGILDYGASGQPAMYAGVTGLDGVVSLPLPEIPSGAGELKDVYVFTDGDLTVGEETRYRSTFNFTLKK